MSEETLPPEETTPEQLFRERFNTKLYNEMLAEFEKGLPAVDFRYFASLTTRVAKHMSGDPAMSHEDWFALMSVMGLLTARQINATIAYLRQFSDEIPF